MRCDHSAVLQIKPVTHEEWKGKGHSTTSGLMTGSEGNLKPTCVMTLVSITHPSVKSAIQSGTETWKHESVVGDKRETSSVNMYDSIFLKTAKATLYNLDNSHHKMTAGILVDGGSQDHSSVLHSVNFILSSFLLQREPKFILTQHDPMDRSTEYPYGPPQNRIK